MAIISGVLISAIIFRGKLFDWSLEIAAVGVLSLVVNEIARYKRWDGNVAPVYKDAVRELNAYYEGQAEFRVTDTGFTATYRNEKAT